MIKIKDYEITIKDEKSPLSCYNRLYEYKSGAKEINPDFCKNILSATNNPKVTRELLYLIQQKIEKDDKEYLQYRSLLIGSALNCINQKSVLEKIRILIEKVRENNKQQETEDYLLASIVYCGLEQPIPRYFIRANIDKRDIRNIEKYFLERKIYKEQTKILQAAQKNGKLGKVYKLKQTNKTERGYLGNQNLEDYSMLEIEDMKILTISNCQNIPQYNNIDSINLEMLNIEQTDLQKLVLRLPESITDISFKAVKGFTKDLNFSNLHNLWEVMFEQSDLRDVENIFFPQDTEIGLLYVDEKTQLPKSFDLSQFSKISVLTLDRERIEEIKIFPEKIGILNLRHYHADNDILDLSSIKECADIEFQDALLDRIKEIKFPENVIEISFKDCRNMPESLNLNVNGLKVINITGETGYNTPLEELILPKGAENIDIRIDNRVAKPKIYYREKPLSSKQKMISMIRSKFTR